MDIGEPRRTYTVEPLEDPIPREEPEEAPVEAPEEAPVDVSGGWSGTDA